MSEFIKNYVISILVAIFTLLLIGFIVMFTVSRMVGAILSFIAIGFLVIVLLTALITINSNSNVATADVDLEEG